MRLFFCILLMLFSICALAQRADDTIRTEQFDAALTERLFLELLNNYREVRDNPRLQISEALQKAAADQAAYCSNINKVVHLQEKNPAKYDPEKRAHFYKNNAFLTGEIGCMLPVGQPITDLVTHQPINIQTYRQLAKQLFALWQHSKEHEKVMASGSFAEAGMGFRFAENGHLLYAFQVFGSTPYHPPANKLSYTDSTFGIAEYNGHCKVEDESDFLAHVLSNYLVRKGDSLFLFYMAEPRLKKLLQKPNDGIAIDLIFRNQFPCSAENNLHPSTVFDGYLLPPVYRDALLKNDLFSDERFFSFVGKIPPAVAEVKDLQFNTMLIQNGHTCRYSFPVEVEAGLIQELSISPQWCEEQGVIKTGRAAFVKEFEIPFDRNQTDAEAYYFVKLDRLISIFGTAIKNIEITAFSSVEGKETLNLQLQWQRADFLEKYILARLQKKVPITKKAEENWNLFYQQLKSSPYARDFEGMSTGAIREKVNAGRDAVVENWLQLQRHATIKIYVEKDYDKLSPVTDMPLVLYDALQRSDTSQAKIAYSRMIDAVKRDEIRKFYLTAVEVPLKREYVELINNYLASIIVESDVFNYTHFSADYFDYIDSAQRRFPDFVPLKFNLEIFKMHCFLRGLGYDEDHPHEETFRKIQDGLQELRKTGLIDSSVMNAALYNYYLTAAVYYRSIYKYREMGAAFDKLLPYLSMSDLSAADVYELGKFFNYFYRLDMTIKLLDRYEKRYPNDRDLTYLYVNSGAMFMMDKGERSDLYYKKLEEFSVKDQDRFCHWIAENYQLMRYSKMKETVCKKCFGR